MTTEPSGDPLTALDRRLVAATRDIRLLSSLSWPAHVQQEFLEHWRNGRQRLPTVEYVRRDFGEARAELAAIAREAPADHAVGEYLTRSAESWRVAAELLEEIGRAHV